MLKISKFSKLTKFLGRGELVSLEVPPVYYLDDQEHSLHFKILIDNVAQKRRSCGNFKI